MTTKPHEKFSEALQELLSERSLTQENVAADLGVSQSTISKWIKNKTPPSDSKLRLFEDKYGMGVAQWLGGSKRQPVNTQGFYWMCASFHCSANELDFQVHKQTMYGLFNWRYHWEEEEPYEDVVFCGSCSRKLVKECGGCGKRIRDLRQLACRKCGKHFVKPTIETKDWEIQLRRKFGRRHPNNSVSFVFECGEHVWSWPGEYQVVQDVQEIVAEIWERTEE